MSTSIRILDADGKKPEFAQWDLDRVLVVSGCSTRPNVRFESGWFPPAIEIESVAAGENFQVIVPNFLLQNPGPLKISVIDQGTEFKTLKTIVAQVSPGKKPLDYWDTQEIEEIMRDGQPGQVMTKVGTEKYAIRWGFPAVINMTQTTVDGHPVYSITYKETGSGEDIVTYGMVYPASQLYRKDETYSRSEAYSKSEVDTALDGAVISRNNITAGSGDFRDSLSKPGMYFKFSGEVTGGVNSHSARIVLFRNPNDEYGKFLVWADGVTGSVYTCVYRGPATGVWSDWVQLPSMGEVTGALGAKLDQNQGSGNAGKVMKVGSDGMLAPAAPAVRSFSKSSVGGHEVFSVGYGVSGPIGEMETTGSILPASETYRKDEVDAALAAKYSKPSGGIPASDLAEAVHNVIRNAVGSKPTYTITIDTENGNAVTGPNYKWIVVSSLGGEPEVGAEFRIETVSDGEITWSSTESVKYQVSGSNSVVIIGWRDRSELEGNPAGISGITRRYYAVSATISGNSVVYSYLGSFSSDLALMDDLAVRSFSKTSVDGHYVFNIGYLESGPLGDMETTGTIYPATETYRKDEVDTALDAKYAKPSGGIPKTDLASAVQTSLGKADSALPATGNAYRAASIPMGELDSTSTETVMTAQVDGITELRDGVCVWLRNGVVASASGVTLNINALGAKPIYNSLSGAVVTTTFVAASTYLFVYNSTRVTGGCWDMVYGYDANTTYTPVKLGFGYATCSTAEATAAKTAALSSYTLTTGGIVAVKFTNAVPAGATLNINSKGAKAIYYKGAAITAGVIKAGDTVTMIYSTYYHVLSIDHDAPPSPSDATPYSVDFGSSPGSSLDYARADHTHNLDLTYLESCLFDVYATNIPVFLYDGQNGVYIPKPPQVLANAYQRQPKINFALVVPPNDNSYPVLFTPSKFDTTTGELHLTGIVGGVLYEATLLPGADPTSQIPDPVMVGTLSVTNLALPSAQGVSF